jgi:hypothetical protein
MTNETNSSTRIKFKKTCLQQESHRNFKCCGLSHILATPLFTIQTWNQFMLGLGPDGSTGPFGSIVESVISFFSFEFKIVNPKT